MIAPLKAYAWQFAALGLAAALLWQTQQRHGAELDAATATTALNQERTRAANAALQLSEDYRQRETENRHEREKIIAQGQAALAPAAAAAERAGVAERRMRTELADYLTRHRAAALDRAAAGQCTPDPAALDLLADLYRRADNRAGQLAAIADDARRRGHTCEQIHDADRKTLNAEGAHAQAQ